MSDVHIAMDTSWHWHLCLSSLWLLQFADNKIRLSDTESDWSSLTICILSLSLSVVCHCQSVTVNVIATVTDWLSDSLRTTGQSMCSPTWIITSLKMHVMHCRKHVKRLMLRSIGKCVPSLLVSGHTLTLMTWRTDIWQHFDFSMFVG
jgi:hypothetical protein